MIPKPFTATGNNPRYDLFAGGLQDMGEREFNWAKVHYENRAIKWPNSHYLRLRNLVRAETARREDEQRGQAA